MINPQNESHGKLLSSMSQDLLLFGKVALPQMFTVRSPKFHRELSTAFLNPKDNKLNIIAPRGHAKSSLAACVWPLHHIFFEDGPKVIVLVSKTEGHAVRLLQSIKDALSYSIPLRQLVGYWGEFSARVWKTNEVILKDGTMIICRGTGQQVLGLKHGNQRPTLVILDDPEDMSNTKTAEAMEYNLRWLLQQLLPTLDPKRGRICVIGTPQHQRCIVEVLGDMQGWHTYRYKAIQEDGTALWPDWISLEKLYEEKASLESIGRVSSFYREYQCQVIGDEDQLFKESFLRYYDGEFRRGAPGTGTLIITSLNGEALKAPMEISVNVFMGVDPASSTRQSADYSVVFPIAIDANKNRYVLDYWRQRASPMNVAEAVINKFQQYCPMKTRIESTGYQEMLREYLRVETAERKIYIPGLEIKETPRTSKSVRLETLEPFFRQGHVFLKKSQQALIDELLLYPRGKHEDLLDGFYYANKNTFLPALRVQTPLDRIDSIWDQQDIEEDGLLV